MAIISLKEAKINLNIDVTNTDYDLILNNLINVVENEVKEICGQRIDAGTTEFIFTGNGKQIQSLKEFPVNSITEILEISDLITAWSSATTISSDYYTLLDTNDIYAIYYENYFTSGYRYKATLNTGNSTIPYPIKQVMFEMLSIYFKQTDIREGIKGGRLGIDSITESAGGVSVNTRFKNLRNEWILRLRPYTVAL